MTPVTLIGVVLTPLLALGGTVVTAVLSRRAARESTAVEALQAVAAEARATTDQVRLERNQAYAHIRVLSTYLRQVLIVLRATGHPAPEPPEELTWNTWR